MKIYGISKSKAQSGQNAVNIPPTSHKMLENIVPLTS